MKKLIVLTIAALFAVTAFGQEKRQSTPEARAEKVTNKMKEKLNLTDEQVAKIKAINLDAAKKKDELKGKGKDQRKEMRTQVKSIEDDRDSKILEVLTEEQKAQYKKMREKSKDHRGGKGKGKGKKGNSDDADEIEDEG